MANGGKPFFAGPPLDLSVRLLEEHFGTPTRGQLVTYKEIEQITRERYGSSRFENVLTLWRKRILESHNIAARRMPGEALKFLHEEERSGADIKDLRFHSRRMLVTTSDLKKVDTHSLTSDALQRHHHALQVTARIEQAVVSGYKALEPPPVTRALPNPAS